MSLVILVVEQEPCMQRSAQTQEKLKDGKLYSREFAVDVGETIG